MLEGSASGRPGDPQAADHERHVVGLVDQIGLVRTSWGTRVLKRENWRSDNVSGLRPGV